MPPLSEELVSQWYEDIYFFAPRGDRVNKRPEQVQQDGEALLQERTPAEQERWQKALDEAVAAGVAAKIAEAAVTAAEMEVLPA